MRALISILLCLTLVSCGRPLTPRETVMAKAIFADEIDTDRARLSNGLIAGSFTYKRKVRPRTTCIERLYPPVTEEKFVTVSPGAMAIFNRVRFREDLYRDDFLAELPDILSLEDALLFVHEMTHVWQWQNRAETGYHPLRAAGEHGGGADPYLFDPNTKTNFLDHGYEQQGAIVEEYMCCRTLAPDAPRTQRLHDMLRTHFPLADLSVAFADKTRVPWAGVQTEGICD